MYERLFVVDCGMFNPLHYITIVFFFVCLALCLFLSRRMTMIRAQKMVVWMGVLTTILEVVKITRRIYLGRGVESWIPLFYCSLFIFAAWLTWTPVRCLKRAGYSFMTMGGILASIFFTFYPSTSLGMYPLISFASIHSFWYHFIMSYCGILILWKGIYKPVKRDSLNYFMFVGTACVLAVICNEKLGSNCMFLTHPYKLPVLQPILEFSKPLYMFIVAIAQSSCMFWLNFLIFQLLSRRKVKSTTSGL